MLEAHVSFLKSFDELPVLDFLLDLLHVADSSWGLTYTALLASHSGGIASGMLHYANLGYCFLVLGPRINRRTLGSLRS